MLLRTVRENLAHALRGIPDVSVHSYVPGSPAPPSLCVGDPLDGTYADDMDGHYTVRVPVHVYLPASDDLSAAAMFDGLVSNEGTASILAAVEADPDLGGACSAAVVIGWERVTGDDELAVVHLVVNVDVIE